jgi:hypothetical protein
MHAICDQKQEKNPVKRRIRKHVPAIREPRMPKKKTGNASRRKMAQRRGKREVSRGEPAMPRIRSQSESSERISSDKIEAKRCVRVTHVIATCSVCRGFCDVVHLLGDKRAHCGQCCPLCGK